MTKTKEDKVSYSVIAGELRKGARLYEVFKHASDAADVLAAFDREQEGMKRKIATLKNEVLELDTLCDEAYNKKEEAIKAKSKSEVEAGNIVQKAKQEAELIKSKSNAYAAKSKEDMEVVLSGIMDKIGIAKNEMNDAVNSKNDAVSALAKVEKQIQSAKDRFLKTLG